MDACQPPFAPDLFSAPALATVQERQRLDEPAALCHFDRLISRACPQISRQFPAGRTKGAEPEDAVEMRARKRIQVSTIYRLMIVAATKRRGSLHDARRARAIAAT